MAAEWIWLGAATAAALAGIGLARYVAELDRVTSQRAESTLGNLINHIRVPGTPAYDSSELAGLPFEEVFERIFGSPDGGGLNSFSEGPATEVVEEPQKSRIERLSQTLRESGVLIAELQAEMKAKVAAVERLRAEEEQSRLLASLREEEAKAVNNLISATISSAHLELQERLERERDELRSNLIKLQQELTTMQKSGLRQQVLFLAVGLIFSIPIGIVINIVW